MTRPPLTGASLLYLGIALGAVAWTASHLFPPINLDVGALLYVARQWLAGDKLYVDVIDVNTPWAIAIHVPPEWLASTIGLDGPTWFSILVCVAVVVSMLLSLLLLHRHGERFGPIVGTVLPLALLIVMGVEPGRNFGQREHLLVIAAAPYLLLAALRADAGPVSPGLRVVIAVFAGLGFAIKPHFLAAAVLVEVLLLARRGLRRSLLDPVPWAMLGVFLAHIVFALLVTPEYFTVLLPMASETYARADATVRHAAGILTGPNLGPAMLVLLPAAIVTFGWSRSVLARAVLMFALGGAVSAAVQGKGFDYHCLPAAAATLLLTVLLAAELFERQASLLPRGSDGFRLLAAVLLLPILLQQGLRLQPFRDQVAFGASPAGAWLKMIARIGGNGQTLVLSGGMYPQFPAINYAGLQMSMPFLTMWPLTDFYTQCDPGKPRYRALDEQSFAERFFFQTVVDGFVEEQPTLLVVDSATGIPECNGEAFDFLAYFMRDPRFEAAFRAYRPVATLGTYAFYKRR